MSELTDAERSLHAMVGDLQASERTGSDDAESLHDRTDLPVAALRSRRDSTSVGESSRSSGTRTPPEHR
ncbi:hypothetical protein ACFPYI_03100 [Halomarina salina]|uniref:Uncharacterized protein n=1 Tax=Halomarina salina TaxID=1872699 RepID=A0ABD5RIA3_9EURY|nr:hypothetical protein [Halomarina salina]